MKHLKNILIIVINLLGIIAHSYSQTIILDKPLELYLLIGQSNMAGRGALDTQSTIANKDIFMLDKSGNWVIAKDPLHFDKPSAGVGPGLSFAQTMLSENKNIQICGNCSIMCVKFSQEKYELISPPDDSHIQSDQ